MNFQTSEIKILKELNQIVSWFSNLSVLEKYLRKTQFTPDSDTEEKYLVGNRQDDK